MKIYSFKFIQIELIAVALMFLVITGWLVASLNTLPQVVDGVRGLVGPEPIALAENTFYGVTDSLQQKTSAANTPGFWSPPALSVPAQPQVAPNLHASPKLFLPRAVTPLYPALAAPGEGAWTPLPNAFDASAAPLMYKTFLHPDSIRPYAQVGIVALDATRLRLHAVAGTREPVSSMKVLYLGLIPNADLASLVAAFNGGFKALHGHHGMMVDGQMVLAPQPNSDTIALYRDGSIRIAPWSAISNTLPLMQSFRQTPAYLAMQGQVNPALQYEQFNLWGKSVSGKTAIWRSALGISADGHTLYYAAGEALTAQTLAQALVAAGASDVAELDVNSSFERFLMYAPSAGNYSEQVLLGQMIYEPGMYVARPAQRDFFYVTIRK